MGQETQSADRGAQSRLRRGGKSRKPAQPKAPGPGDPVTLAGLTLDPENRRRRTTRGARMLVESLGQVGAARSIVIDEHNEVLAGNGVVEAAAEAGITKLQVVEADGATVVAVRRRGLTAEAKRALALFDNRAGELAEWDPEQLAADASAGRPLAPWFDEKELKKLTSADGTRAPTVSEVATGDVQDQFWIAIRGPLPHQALALQRLRAALRDLDGVEIDLGTVPSEAWT